MSNNQSILVAITFFLLAFAMYFAADISEVEKHYNPAQKDVAAKKELWLKSQPEIYDYKVWQGCMFATTYRVHVEHGRVSYADIEGSMLIKHLTGIEGLFDKLIVAHKVAEEVKVVWNARGYPEKVGIDWSNAIDDECGVQILEFNIGSGA